jgi:hypothetical protein
VWDQLAKLMKERRAIDAPLAFHSAAQLPLLLRASLVVEFAASGDPALRQKARDSDCGADRVQQALFVDHLERACRYLPADDPYLRVILAGEQPAAAVTRLLAETRLCDSNVLEQLLAGGQAAVDASKDPAIVIARVLCRCITENLRRKGEIETLESSLGTKLAKLLFAVYGDDISPDATGTLRWSDGRVAGYLYRRLDGWQLGQPRAQQAARSDGPPVRRQHRVAGERVPLRRARRTQRLRASAGDHRSARQGLRGEAGAARAAPLSYCSGKSSRDEKILGCLPE